MGTSKDVSHLVGKIDKYRDVVPKANGVAVRQAALAAKPVMIAGPVRSGLPVGGSIPRHKKGKWGVSFDVKGTTRATAMLRYRGPVHWIESGTNPHPIIPKGYAKARRGARISKGLSGSALTMSSDLLGKAGGKGARLLKTPYGPVPFVNHKGSKARPFWSVTQVEVVKVTTAVLKAAHSRALLESFK